MFDLGYFGVEKDYPEQIRHYLAERRDTKSCLKKEDYNRSRFQKEDSCRAYHMQFEKIQIPCKYI